jgi:glutamate formiminotransferase/formiminotetrahydrofolate cyclodeaminase
MSGPLVECVPNFSEGRDRAVLDAIAAAITSVDGVTLLDVDPGASTNRTVVTFVGSPEAVVEAAVRAGRASAEHIDMRLHHGAHPRFGAMDVCPFVPVSDVTMEEVADLAREAGGRLAEEVGLTVYLYERAASTPHRRNLADLRHGEYEGLEAKLGDPAWQPDFGPAVFNPRSGATAVGAREFLVAYNVNLNTTSTRRANAVAFDVRERGRVRRVGDPLTGEVVHDADGEPEWEPGMLPGVKAIGWFIEEYGISQVSMNLTDITAVPIHMAFEAVAERASARGMRATGSEIVGMVPLRAMLDAGRYYLARQQRSAGIPDEDIVHIAIRSLGLDDLTPFDPHQRIIEWRLETPGRLVDLTAKRFVNAVASEAPAPGGGSVAALAGSLGAALGTMVANLSAHKRGWDDRWEEFSDWAARGKELHGGLLQLVDEDSAAFDRLMEAHRLPRVTPEETVLRAAALESATRGAIEVPLAVMAASLEAMGVIGAMATGGLGTSVSDAGVGALMARAAVRGAHLNVAINALGLADDAERTEYLERARQMDAAAEQEEARVLTVVRERMAVGNP